MTPAHQRAREIVQPLYDYDLLLDGSGVATDLVDAIAAALLAERERCAKVAEEQSKPAHTYASENADIYRAVEASAKHIAKSIRQGDRRE